MKAIRQVILFQLMLWVSSIRAIDLFSVRAIDCPSNWLMITEPCQFFNVQLEPIFWGMIVLLILLECYWTQAWSKLLQSIKENWLLFIFIGLAVVSVAWSIQPTITWFRLIVLICGTLAALFVSAVYEREQVLANLRLFFFCAGVVNLALVLISPAAGVMPDAFYRGAWKGIYWHRNYLGTFMALAFTIALVDLFSLPGKPQKKQIFSVVFIVISGILLVKSRSATGLITVIALIATIVLAFLWIKFRHKIKQWHIAAFAIFAIASILIFIKNAGFFFGLLGRNTSLTGRVPMWQYVVSELVSRRPWLGYGYGAIWHLTGIRTELAIRFQWGAQVMIGDNGYLDILLHLGVIGLTVLIIILAAGFVRALRNFLADGSIVSAFPLVVLVFVLVANISLSLILESEALIWVIAVTVLTGIWKNHKLDETTLPLFLSP